MRTHTHLTCSIVTRPFQPNHNRCACMWDYCQGNSILLSGSKDNCVKFKAYMCIFTTVVFVFSQGNFFQNIGSIILFAVMGTAVSTCIVGGGLYGLSQLGVIFSLNLVQRSVGPSLYVQPLPLTHLYSVPAFRSCYIISSSQITVN